jgi:uncharacterized protein
MELPEVASVLSTWARGQPLVKRVYLFGSRVRGEHGPQSDIDIAVELDPVAFRGADDSGGLATWMFEAPAWREELKQLIPLKVQLERYHREQTPTIGKALAESSQLIYEKAT